MLSLAIIFISEYALAHLVWALRYKPKIAGSIPDWVTGIFLFT